MTAHQRSPLGAVESRFAKHANHFMGPDPSSWTAYLVLFKDHPAMQIVHLSAMKNRDFNSAFLNIAERIMKPTISDWR
jgi:hypothetical protein